MLSAPVWMCKVNRSCRAPRRLPGGGIGPSPPTQIIALGALNHSPARPILAHPSLSRIKAVPPQPPISIITACTRAAGVFPRGARRDACIKPAEQDAKLASPHSHASQVSTSFLLLILPVETSFNDPPFLLLCAIMKAVFVVASLAACALAQRLHIQAPAPNSHINKGAFFTVELEQDVSLPVSAFTTLL